MQAVFHPESGRPFALERLVAAVARIDSATRWGRVVSLSPMFATVAGPVDRMVLNGRLVIEAGHGDIP